MKSMNLIKVVNNEIVLNESAAQQLRKFKGPVCIVSACGEYRTGKSFLLNSLFDSQCFDVSSTTKACTKGINMIKQPIKCNGKNLWVLDTEGFGSLQQDSKYDAKIFLLTVLFSEIIIYNSMGSIDQLSISKIALMCKEAEMLMSKSDSSNSQSTSQFLGQSDFYWVLRDFSLQLVDKDGDPIKPDQYLEESLIGSNQKAQMEKKCIKRFFRERHLFPLVRPCQTEKSLYSLNELPRSNLRPQFLQQIEHLNDKIYANVRSKSINGQQINGSQFCDLLKYYVKMVNQSDFSAGLSVTWNHILSCEREKAVANIEDQIREKIRRCETMLPLNDHQLAKLEKQFSEIIALNSETLQENTEQLNLLNNEVLQSKNKIMSKFQNRNVQRAQQKCATYLEQLSKQNINKLQSKLKSQGLQRIVDSVIEILQNSKQQYFTSFNTFNSMTTSQPYIRWLQKHTKSLFQICFQFFSQNLTQKEQKFKQSERKYASLSDKVEQLEKIQKKLKNQLQQITKSYHKTLEECEGYTIVIQRMEKVSETLKQQYRILQLAHSSTVQEYEQKIKQFQQKQQKFIEEISELNHRWEQDLDQNNQQSTKKVQQILEVLSNERQKFQQLLLQKNEELLLSKKQVQQKQQQIVQMQQKMHKNIEKIDKESQNKVKQKDQQLKNFQSKIKSLEDKLNQMTSTLQKKKDEIFYYENRIKEFDNEMRAKQKALVSQINLTRALQQQSSGQRNFFKSKTSDLQQKLDTLNKKIQILECTNKKLQQENQMLMQQKQILINKQIQREKISEEKYRQRVEIEKEKNREGVQLEKEEIVGKLKQAAQRIQDMNLREIQANLKIVQYQERIRELKEVNQRLVNEKKQLMKGGFQNDGIDALGKQKISKSQKMIGREDKRQLNGSDSKSQIEKLREEVNKKDILLIALTEKLQKYVQINENLFQFFEGRKKEHEVQYSQNPENMMILMKQNEILKEELIKAHKKGEQIKGQTMKWINFHALLKKNLAKQNFQDEDTMKQNILAKTFETLRQPYDLQIKISQLETDLSKKEKQLQKQNSQYKRNLQQLDEIIIQQKEQLQKCEEKERVYLQEIQNLCKAKETTKIQFQRKIQQLKINLQRISTQLKETQRKYEDVKHESDLWRNRPINAQDNNKSRAERASAYKQRINNIFQQI